MTTVCVYSCCHTHARACVHKERVREREEGQQQTLTV